MAAAQKTKLLLAQELKNKARTTPIRKITVSELCAACGLDRRTFYNHFKDVYDLTAWIFDQAVDAYLPWQNAGRAKRLAEKLTRLRDDAPFYRRALSEDSQNALGRHFITLYLRAYEEAYLTLTGAESVPPEDELAIRFQCYGILGVVRRWLFNGCVPPPEEMAAMMLAVMPPTLRRLYGVEER